MFRYGIPEYRLQKDMMDKELEGVWKLGVDAQYNVKLGKDFTIDDLFEEGFDAVFLAIGAWTSNRTGPRRRGHSGGHQRHQIPDREDTGHQVPVDETKEVVVLGGGFTTFDCTRTSLRLGAKVHTAYRRGRKEMSATAKKSRTARPRARTCSCLRRRRKHHPREGDSRRHRVPEMQLGEPDASGRRRPVPIPGSEYVINCDTIIPAYWAEAG